MKRRGVRHRGEEKRGEEGIEKDSEIRVSGGVKTRGGACLYVCV
jgi:D-serine dehydratase